MSCAASLALRAVHDARDLDIVVGADIPRVVRSRLRAIRHLPSGAPRLLLDAFSGVEGIGADGQFGPANPDAARASINGQPLTVRIGYQAPNPRLAATVGAITKACAPAGITVVDATSETTGPQTLRDGQIDVLLASTANGSSPVPIMRFTAIHPASPRHIAKYSTEHRVLVRETPEDYAKKTLPFITALGCPAWVSNLMADVRHGRALPPGEMLVHAEHVDDDARGFAIFADSKWDRRDMDALYLLALPVRGDLRSLRDLDATHLPLLDAHCPTRAARRTLCPARRRAHWPPRLSPPRSGRGRRATAARTRRAPAATPRGTARGRGAQPSRPRPRARSPGAGRSAASRAQRPSR